MPRKSAREDLPIGAAVERLDDDTTRQLLVAAAEQHETVAQAVRLAAADDDDRLAVLRAAVDDGLRTRRHLDYWASSAWAADAAPVVDALASEVAARPSAELVVLLQRAAEHLVKVILHADDSDGTIGALASDVLEQHRLACAAGVAEPRALAKWMVRFTFEDQDFFTIDPVAYVDALGDAGLAVYRQEVANRSDSASAPTSRSAALRDLYGEFPSFAARYAAERLAVIDRDVGRLVELLGGDLSAPHQFTRVAEAMVELGRPADALAWARRGIAETTGWQVAKLYDLAANLLTESADLGEVVVLRGEQHERMPSSSTYSKLQTAARATDSWEREIVSARAVLATRDPASFVDALLADGEPGEAWRTATSGNCELSSSQWQRLAEAREATEPAEAMVVYQRLADEALDHADKRAYQAAVRYLKAARRAAAAADRSPDFTQHVTALRERNRRRPSLIAMLDKAGMR
jgi:hypothetical protein